MGAARKNLARRGGPACAWPHADRQGFTLVEVMVTVGIMGTVIAVAMSTIHTASVHTNLGTSEAWLQDRAQAFAEKVASDLRGASCVRYDAENAPQGIRFYSNEVEREYGDCIRFRLPVDTDADADGAVDMLDTDGDGVGDATVWGSIFGVTQTRDEDIIYRFVQNANAVDGTLDEKHPTFRDVDLNEDGDTNDSFRRGFFTRQTYMSQTNPPSASDIYFLCEDGDGDGVDDPIFEATMDGNGDIAVVTINLLAVRVFGRNRIPVRGRAVVTVRPHNR